MKIVVVDNVSQRLTELEKTIKKVFPGDTVKSFTDPMLAAQYGVLHSVDIIIAERKMLRMDGLEMVYVVRKFDESIRMFLIKEPDETFDGMDNSGIAGWLERPVIENKLREIASARRA